MQEKAFAKINLALHVRGRQADGYHRIETIFAFAEHGDVLSVEPGDGLSLRVEGPFAADLSTSEDNLAMRAARALSDRFGVGRGAALILDKRLPVGSGIGGGSADAAAALRLLARWWALDVDEAVFAGIGAGLGADVPACIASRTAIGTGRGEVLTPAPDMLAPATPLLLVNPGVALSTAEIFARWSGRDGGSLPEDWRDGRNDLQPSALKMAPEISAVLDTLASQAGASAARMSGSGATCFAIFENERDRDAAAARIAGAHPGWWCLATRSR